MCNIFKKVGININTVPVLDVRRKKSHNVIGNRSFSQNPERVTKLGKICVDLYKKNKIATIVKHIPGHGMSKCDSHYKTPIIKTNKKELIKKDFKPFRECKSLFAITAHAVYGTYDLAYTHLFQVYFFLIIDQIIILLTLIFLIVILIFLQLHQL